MFCFLIEMNNVNIKMIDLGDKIKLIIKIKCNRR